MIAYTSPLAFLTVARRFTAEDWTYNLELLEIRACELGGQACKNLRAKIELWKKLLFPERVTARKYGRGFSFSLAAITGIAQYLKSDSPENWRGLSLHHMLSSLCEFFKSAIRRAFQDPVEAMNSARKTETRQKSPYAVAREMRAAKAAQAMQATASEPQPESPQPQTSFRHPPTTEEERTARRQFLASLDPFAG